MRLACLVVLFGSAFGAPLCQPEPRDPPAVEAAWDASIRALPSLARTLPGTPDRVLRMPVDGVRVREVRDTWGADRGDGLVHAGQDIFARRGTPVRSATDGLVWRVGSSERGGRWVYVLGAGGRRYYYAHLERVAPGLKEGARVQVGTLLGFVGQTGNAETTPPHLHFAMFDGYDPQGPCRFPALNPLPLLRDRAPD
ncbi:M23 family metallopeptidase [Deinococcus maricopensis]|uniref:Peptidase M23 n=1 Tax=Deinococcus maricopensis (strain DSM 21211 / LMG 22137 / NRRL B-23946 / LB-34) TaxID=709986 RepID=E8U4Q5_DEIML|nr:M23 family metallopeptidase [Deinococcus maricopensis]ADV68920.1 Peptidase M23 [Deinococcus maricopensis DSM 21211]